MNASLDFCTMTGPSVIALNRAFASRSCSGVRSATTIFAPSGVQSRSVLAAMETPGWRGTSASAARSVSQIKRCATGRPLSSSAVRIARRFPSRDHAARRTLASPLNGFSVAPVFVSMTRSVTREGERYVGSP